MKIVLTLLVMIVTTLFVPNDKAQAHPHAWIDLESTLIMNDSQQITALRHRWLFGDFYSSYVLSDIQAAETDVREGLQETARGNLVELEQYDYFTKFTVDGMPEKIDTVKTFETGVINGRIYLEFTVRLASPVNPVSQSVRYAVFDPTYYIEILHTEGTTPKIEGAVGIQCQADITSPEPTFNELAYAASLDQTESGGDGLGELFAEWVSVRCP